MLSTIHRRHILSYLEREKTVSLRSLKTTFVGAGEMNQTTLYRILDKFLAEGLVHRADFADEKYFTICQCQHTKPEAVKLRCCVSCHTIAEDHSPLPPDSLRSETIELVKHCEKCPAQ